MPSDDSLTPKEGTLWEADGFLEEKNIVEGYEGAKILLRLGKTKLSAIWPIRQADITVEFLRGLSEGCSQSIGQLRFAILPPGLRLPEVIRREGLDSVRARLAGAKPLKYLLGA